MPYTINLPTDDSWALSKGGLSVDAGNTRIRCEAGVPTEERRALCLAIAAIPKLLRASEAMLEATCIDGLTLEQMRSLRPAQQIARRLLHEALEAAGAEKIS
ncbi:hypothetical protein LCGC14_1848130 [marine sediment metagenome]|uniref:Uncharacterized protein n=1 Tax=marine sediment metagenome TaxID=412755 RepID=A0A0F9GZG8_9ZZZZ